MNLKMSHEGLDTIATTINTNEEITGDSIRKTIYENRIKASRFRNFELINFKSSNLILLGNFLDHADIILKELTRLHDVNYDSSLLNSSYQEDMKHLIYNLILNVPNTFFKDVETYLESFNSRVFGTMMDDYSFRMQSYVIGYIVGIFISFAFLIYVLFQYEKLYLNLISSYLNLNESEIRLHGRLLQRYMKILKVYKFHEENIIKEYTESPQILDKIEEEEINSKKGIGNRISHKKSIRHDRLFPSVLKTGICGFLLVLAFIGFLMLSFIYNNFINQNIELEKVNFTTLRSGIDHKNIYLSLIFDTLFEREFTVSGDDIAKYDVKSSASLKFITQYVENDEQMKDMFHGEDYTPLNLLVSGNICEDLVEKYPEQVLYYRSCNAYNSGVAKQGMVNFFYYQNDLFRSVREKLDDLGPRGFTLNTPEIFDFQGFDEVWKSMDFLEMRLSQLTIGHYFFKEINRIMS